jgi:hypothetical protein
MSETQAIFECVNCQERHEERLPPVVLGLEAWPTCCGLPLVLVDAEGSWEWESATR